MTADSDLPHTSSLTDAARHIQQLSALLEVSKAMASQIRLDDLLRVILGKATEVVDADRGSLFLYDESRGELWSKIAEGLHGREEIRFSVAVGTAGDVARTHKGSNIPDAYADPRFNPDADRQTGYRTTSILSQPLLTSEGKLIGVIQALNKRGATAFDDQDELLLAALAEHAAVALERAQLTETYFSGETPDLRTCRRRAEDLLGTGSPLLAYDLIEEALQNCPTDVRLRQLKALALGRSGVAGRANEIMRELYREGHADGETLGLLARTDKDLAAVASSDAERRAHMEAAYASYERGYLLAREQRNVADAYYTGINAAALGLLLGRQGRAQELAREVRALCKRELAAAGSKAEYWVRATLGEAALVLGEKQVAEEEYTRAAELADKQFADLGSTRHQARLLLRCLGEDPSWVDRILSVPPIVAFSGLMIDRPGARRRFPPSLEKAVSHEIRARLERLRPVAGFASAACGSDILFLEEMIRRGDEVHVVLAFPPDEFRRVSVEVVPGADWGRRLDQVLRRAATVITASEHRSSGSTSSLVYANLILAGMAELRAHRLETDLVPLAVWDGLPGASGGTASMVEHWRSRGQRVEVIDPASLGPERERDGKRQSPRRMDRVSEKAEGAVGFSHELMAMLFADAVGYSKLSEDQIPLFVEQFLGSVAKLIDRTAHSPILKETYGDGFYFVFPTVESAGHFGLELRDLVTSVDWEERGLPSTLDLRIALHCGPVYSFVDPVTDSHKYSGPHTSRTARIEPITPPGQVYASEVFAAVAVSSGVEGLAFEYVGRTALAKKYGSLALYSVQRKN